jgi:hypothetical protein
MTEATVPLDAKDQELPLRTIEAATEAPSPLTTPSPKNRPIELVFGFVGPTGVKETLI